MAANSFFNHLQDLDFTNEEQDVVFTPTIQWGSLNEDSDLLVIAKMISSKPNDDNTVVRAFQGKQLNAAQRVDDGKPPNKVDPTPTRASMQDAVSFPHPPIMVLIMNDATSTHPPSIAPKLAAATSHHPPSMATKLADATSKLPPTAVPKTAAANLSHPSNVAIVGQEANDDNPYLYDNLGLESTVVTALPIPTEEELEKDMGKSFLATSSMLIVFDEWASKANSSSAVLNDKESPAALARGTKRRSSMPNDNKLKKPRPPINTSKTRAGISSVKNSPAEAEYQPHRGK
ncbi:hypothetical protein V6N13_024950 [Hibiscus sabdariffa]|uniref:Uncharacterized protein n=1 Tax=Hibiscus sabdariffa TaxID=183260 RepID=A0ABR2BIZ7_9ROSI